MRLNRHLNQTKGCVNSNRITTRIPTAAWIQDTSKWDKFRFIEETSSYLWEAYGSTTEQDKHALAMLAETSETFVVCCEDIKKNGLIITHHNGVLGKNHHVEIRDKSIAKIVLLMNELGLTPKSRFPFMHKGDPEIDQLLLGPFV